MFMSLYFLKNYRRSSLVCIQQSGDACLSIHQARPPFVNPSETASQVLWQRLYRHINRDVKIIKQLGSL